jgi:hypothetical protein
MLLCTCSLGRMSIWLPYTSGGGGGGESATGRVRCFLPIVGYARLENRQGYSVPNVMYTDKKENKIFLIYKEIQSGAVAKSYMRKGFLLYEEMRKYFPIYEKAVSNI